MSEDLKPWLVIQFKPVGRPPAVKGVELVPSSWAICEKKKCRAYYHPGPYNNKIKKIIRDMIKKCDEPNDDWPSHAIQLRGSSSNYRLYIYTERSIVRHRRLYC